jgi:hypothetical protein
MCNSKENGGRRCASSLEPAFKKALATLNDSKENLSSQMIHDLLPPISAYAATPAGRRIIDEIIWKETVAQKTGAYAGFDFRATANQERLESQSIFGQDDFYLAKDYFEKNLPYFGLLSNAIIEGDRISQAYHDREQDIYEIARQKRDALIEAPLLLPSDPNEQSAYDVLETAIAKGKDIAAPAGSVVFILDYSESDYDGANMNFLGVYQSAEDAKRAAVAKVIELIDIEGWGSDLAKADSPWGALADMDLAEWNRRKIEWFKFHSDDEILEWAATDMPNQLQGIGGGFSATTFNIWPVKVEAIAETYPGETHLTD